MTDYDDLDAPDDESWDDESWDDDVETLPCPHCGADIYEEAQQCPHCGQYVTHDTSVWAGRPWWWIVLGLLGIAAVVLVFSILRN